MYRCLYIAVEISKFDFLVLANAFWCSFPSPLSSLHPYILTSLHPDILIFKN